MNVQSVQIGWLAQLQSNARNNFAYSEVYFNAKPESLESGHQSKLSMLRIQRQNFPKLEVSRTLAVSPVGMPSMRATNS